MKKYGIPLIDEGETGDWHFFVFDYVEGKTLDKLQRERGALPVADALKITEQIAESLEYIHSKGIVHCDIKPSNILFTNSGKVKLIDFGVARPIGKNPLTFTPGYASPEQYGQAPLDPRADVYALGATLYNLLTAKAPEGFPQRISTDEISEPTKGLVEKATSPNPRDRYQSAHEFMVAIEKIMKKSTVGVVQMAISEFARDVILTIFAITLTALAGILVYSSSQNADTLLIAIVMSLTASVFFVLKTFILKQGMN
jgi:serine/threonine-protein kinase